MTDFEAIISEISFIVHFSLRRVHHGVFSVRPRIPRDPGPGGGRVDQEAGGGRPGSGNQRRKKEKEELMVVRHVISLSIRLHVFSGFGDIPLCETVQM